MAVTKKNLPFLHLALEQVVLDLGSGPSTDGADLVDINHDKLASTAIREADEE